MKFFRKIWNSLSRAVRELSPHCRDVSRLQSDALDRTLPFRQRLGMRLHLLICKWCRRYGQHLSFLRAAGRKCAAEEHLPSQKLSSNARERIRQALKKEQDAL